MQTKIELNKVTNNINIFKLSLRIEDKLCSLYFHKDLSNLNEFNKYYVSKITKDNLNKLSEIFPSTFEKISELTENLISTLIFTGHIILEVPDSDIIYKISLPNIPERTPSESLLDPTNVYGSRDGFVENIKKNISLIQRKLKADNLKIEQMFIGKRTKTEINVLYINDIASKSNVREVINRLNRLNIGSVLTINTIAREFTKNSLFPLVGETGSSEFAANYLLKGKIAILIDQIPVAIIVPISIDYFTTSGDETTSPFFYTVYKKIINYLLVFLSIFFLGFYVAIINYHSNNLSLLIISEIKVTARGTTIPLALEIILTLLLFEILKMSNTKTPSSNIQNVIVIVGGLLIGQNTVNSGFIGAFNLVITAICYLSTFGVTNNQHLIISFSIFRLILLISSVILGIYGFLIATIFIIIYLKKLYSLNTPYLAPISPTLPHEIIQSFLPSDAIKKKERPRSLDPIDKDYGE